MSKGEDIKVDKMIPCAPLSTGKALAGLLSPVWSTTLPETWLNWREEKSTSTNNQRSGECFI